MKRTLLSDWVALRGGGLNPSVDVVVVTGGEKLLCRWWSGLGFYA